MGKKESNEVRMIGIVPFQGADPIPVGKIPDGGTQVVKDDSAANTTATVHTVNNAKTLYLTSIIEQVRNDNAAIKTALFYVTDGDDTIQYYFDGLGVGPSTQHRFTATFNPPIEIATGWKIKIETDAADCHIGVFIHGYEA